MRGLRSTIALIVVFGGLLGYIYFVTWKAPADTPSKPKVFASLEAEKIGELRIKGSAGETTLRKLNGQWEIVEPLSTRADSQEASTITSGLAALEETRVVDENPAALVDYGLATPRIEVSFKTDADKEYQRLLIGERAPAGGDLFAMRGGEKRVVLISSTNETTFDRTAFQLREKALIKFERDKIDGLEISGGGNSVSLAKIGSDWKLVKPFESGADFGTVEGILGRLQTAQMKSVVAESATPEDVKKYGFDPPAQTLTLSAGSARATLWLGNEADNFSTYARDASTSMVMTVEKGLADELKKSPDDYRRKDLFDFRSYSATRLEFVRGGQSVIFERVKGQNDAPDTWQRVSPNPKEAAKDPMDSLLSRLSMMRATSFVESGETGLTAPAVTVDVKFDDGKKQERVTFGKAGDSVYAARPDIPGAAKVDATDFTEALKTLDELSK